MSGIASIVKMAVNLLMDHHRLEDGGGAEYADQAFEPQSPHATPVDVPATNPPDVAMGFEVNMAGTAFMASGEVGAGVISMNSGGPWYDDAGLVVHMAEGGTVGNSAYMKSVWDNDVIKGTGNGLSGSITGDAMVIGNLRSLHDLDGAGVQMGGTAFSGGRGVYGNYLTSMDPSSPDSYQGMAVGGGVGFGSEVHVQVSQTKVFTLGDLLRRLR